MSSCIPQAPQWAKDEQDGGIVSASHLLRAKDARALIDIAHVRGFVRLPGRPAG